MRIMSTRFAKIAVAASTAMLCALALGPAASSAAVTHAWAQDGFDAGNTGFNPNETIINRTNVESLNWSFAATSPRVSTACTKQFPPVVAGGRLFVGDEAGFAVYNAATGAPLWSVRFALGDDSGVAAFAVSGSTLLVATIESCHSASDQDGRLTAYNVAGGARLWSVFRDTPIFTLVVDNGVAAAVGDDSADTLATGYRISDGADLWDIFTATDSAVSAAGRLLLNTSAGTEAVDITTGAVAWSKPDTWVPLAATPDGKRYIVRTFSGDLLEIFAAAGGIAWTKAGEAGPPVFRTNNQVAVDTSQLYVTHGNTLDVFVTTTGAPVWSGTVLGAANRPIVAGGVVWVVSAGDVSAFNTTTGANLNFLFGFNEGYLGHVVVENGRLYITNGRVLDTYIP